ncbi:GNAT family N-acetyltransferase [Streptomyces sporangiiformans]|uniref:GNAT family N-acetyltransferase n=1 Tax=Streptomyces sporangiiformans TaxID=2315329 RepID=A0A505DEN6_9ACTN|nr:GNAT family N-acetyltransferase [Streptomyces sporangiiformans]TPQ21317.1 GNAT family N-acetyltransferase [Streptomyces sporangiiformans]
MALTLAEIAEDPLALTSRLDLHDGTELVLRPLTHADAEPLAGFLGALSPESRRLSTFDGYDLVAAQELCDAIARYDKLRLVLEEGLSGRIVGLFEFSLALTPWDIARYHEAGIRLAVTTDCRFGPTLADDYQGRGVGTLAFPLITSAARRLGRTVIILWGGVRSDNPQAIRYYEKNGFQPVGPFTGPDGSRSLDMMLDLRAGPDSEPSVH